MNGKCANCGADLNGAKFCAMCGTPAAGGVDPKAIECVENGNSHFERCKFKDAIKEYDKAIKIAPKYAEAYFRRGMAYYAIKEENVNFNKNWNNAYSDFTEATTLNPGNAEAWFMRGQSCWRIKNGQNISIRIGFYNEAIKINPEYSQAYYERGYWYHWSKNFSKAIDDYEMAMRLDANIDAKDKLEYARSKKDVFGGEPF